MITIKYKDGAEKYNIPVMKGSWREFKEIDHLILHGEILEEFIALFPTFPWPTKREVVVVGEMAQYMFANYVE